MLSSREGTYKGCPYGGFGAVYVGRGWAFLRLRWITFGTSHQVGEARVAAGRQGRITRTLDAARGCRRGGVAGAEPPHKG
ncbi:MAG: hypothetical protein OXF50_05545, partial [Caldilineaceae bacterium]|nr:hypothetical protein [Caldilineaceae bacterium]